MIKKATTTKAALESTVSSISVSRKFTFTPTGASQYESLSIQAMVTAETYEEAADKVEEIMLLEAERANVQFAEVAMSANEVASDLEGEEAAEDEAEGEAGEEDVTPEAVMAMKRSELLELITENTLDVDPTKLPKINDLRAAVVEAAFGGEEDGEAEEGEEAEGEEEGAEEEEAEITEEDIKAMTRVELVAFAKSQEIPLTLSDYAKNPKGLGNMASDVIKALEAAAEEEGEEEAGEEEGDAADDPYTSAGLTAMTVPELKEIYAEWELGAFPAGAPPVAKKKAVAAILAAQEG